jgi:uncharacterized hydrophobic protein (TIGR00271 family)
MSANGSPPTHLFKTPDMVYQEAYEGRQFDAVYFAMLIFACLIALMGLLLNSPAVIIGAMLISPLMGPILACGLALTTAEWSLGKKAGRNLVFSVAEVIIVAVIATHLSPLREATPEILARTNPNLMDLLIAFFSGLAGTVAMASRRTAFTILPGVAIATAVMPPLATVGYGIATGQGAVARGAFMLFFTNFTAIVLSASVVFLVLGVRPQEQRLGQSHHLLVRWRIVIAASLLLILSVPLMRTLMRAADEASVRRQVTDSLKQAMREHGNRRLDSVSVELGKQAVNVSASVQTANYMEPEDIGRLRTAVEQRVRRPVRLQVEQVQLAKKAPSEQQLMRDFLAAGLVRPATSERPAAPAVAIGNLQEHIESALRPLLAAAGVTARVSSVGRAADGVVVVNATAQARQLTSADMWKVAAAGLASEVSAPVNLNVTVAATGASLQVAYQASGIRPPAGELRHIRKFVAALPQDVNVAFLLPADVNTELTKRRMEELQRIVGRPAAAAELEPPPTPNVGTLVPLQLIRAASTQAAAAAGATGQ